MIDIVFLSVFCLLVELLLVAVPVGIAVAGRVAGVVLGAFFLCVQFVLVPLALVLYFWLSLFS